MPGCAGPRRCGWRGGRKAPGHGGGSPLDAEEASAFLAGLEGLRPGRVRRLAGGWANWTFEVDGRWIFRFPRSEAVARAMARELALLPELARAVPFRVPEPLWAGEHRGRPFMGYARIGGEPLDGLAPERRGRLWPALGRALGEVHAFPLERARVLTAGPGTPEAWRAEHVALGRRARARLRGRLGARTALRLDEGFERLLASLAFVPALVHRDLGPEHILVGADDTVAGIVDWEDAAAGDPAIDLAGLWRAFGPDAGNAALAAYARGGDAGLRRRVAAYAWLGAVHDLLHAEETGDRALAERSLAELDDRLRSYPGPSAPSPSRRRASPKRQSGKVRR